MQTEFLVSENQKKINKTHFNLRVSTKTKYQNKNSIETNEQDGSHKQTKKSNTLISRRNSTTVLTRKYNIYQIKKQSP